MDMIDTSHPAPTLSRRLGIAGLGPVLVNAAAWTALGISTIQSVTAPPDAWFAGMGMLMFAVVLGMIGIPWSIIAAVMASVALAVPRRNPFGRRRNDRADAIAILAANLAILNIWILIIGSVVLAALL
jgi:hypothetical protein